MLLERKSSQACMNKVYFILSNKGGGGWFESLKKMGGGEGKKTKNGNPLSIFNCTMTTEAESQLLLISRREQSLTYRSSGESARLTARKLFHLQSKKGRSSIRAKQRSLSMYIYGVIFTTEVAKTLATLVHLLVQTLRLSAPTWTQENPHLLHFL